MVETEIGLYSGWYCRLSTVYCRRSAEAERVRSEEKRLQIAVLLLRGSWHMEGWRCMVCQVGGSGDLEDLEIVVAVYLEGKGTAEHWLGTSPSSKVAGSTATAAS